MVRAQRCAGVRGQKNSDDPRAFIVLRRSCAAFWVLLNANQRRVDATRRDMKETIALEIHIKAGGQEITGPLSKCLTRSLKPLRTHA